MFLESVRLLVSDYDACFRFYRDVMGFSPTWGAEGIGESYATFAVSDRTLLALFRRRHMAEAVGTDHLPPEATAQDTAMLVFEVGAPERVDARLADLRERGAHVVAEPRDFPDWGIRAAYVRDPDGNLIEIEAQLPADRASEGLRTSAEKYAQVYAQGL